MQYMLTPYATEIVPFAWWEGAFTEQELNWLQAKARSANTNAEVGGGADGRVDGQIRRSQVSWMESNKETEWVFRKLADVASKLNSQFFRLDLTGFGESLLGPH